MRRRNALAIRILLATAVRSAELYHAKWADVDLEGAQWHIPKSKTGAAMDLPLPPVVVDWFRELRALAGSFAQALSARSRSRAARHGGDAHLNKDTLREAIDHWLRTAKPEVRRFKPHELRSTVKSHLRALGVPRGILEMCLNPKLSGWRGFMTGTRISWSGGRRWGSGRDACSRAGRCARGGGGVGRRGRGALGGVRQRLAWRVDRAIDLEAWRTAKASPPLH